MPKQYTVTSYKNEWWLPIADDGTVTGLSIEASLVFDDGEGDTFTKRQTYGVWDVASPAMRTAFQQLYTAAKVYLDAQILEV